MLKGLFGKTQNEKKKNLIRIIYLTVAVILMVTVALAITLAVGSKKGDETSDPKDKTGEPNTTTVTYSLSDTKKGTLLIVNKNSDAFDFNVNPETDKSLVSMSASQYYSLKNENMRANKEALTALNKMLEAFYAQAEDKDTAKKLTIWSAYRSFNDQKGYSTPAGHSDFHTGMLFELTMDGKSDSIKDNSVFDWIYENAHNYGFIERYPESKSSHTGVSGFNNAFRYVGTVHAKYIKDNGLCLEEYVSLIQNSTEPITSDGYKITYVKANTEGNTDITLTSKNYSISGDNKGGFIITSK